MFDLFKKENPDGSSPLGGMGMGDVIKAAQGLGGFIVEMKGRLEALQADITEIKAYLNIKKGLPHDGNDSQDIGDKDQPGNGRVSDSGNGAVTELG